MNLTAYLSLVCLLILGGCAPAPETPAPPAQQEEHNILSGKFQGGEVVGGDVTSGPGDMSNGF